MHVVYVHDAKIAKENGLTLQFCFNYPSKMSRNVAMYTFLTNYNTFRRKFLLKARRVLYFLRLPAKNKQDTKSGLNTCHIIIK